MLPLALHFNGYENQSTELVCITENSFTDRNTVFAGGKFKSLTNGYAIALEYDFENQEVKSVSMIQAASEQFDMIVAVTEYDIKLFSYAIKEADSSNGNWQNGSKVGYILEMEVSNGLKPLETAIKMTLSDTTNYRVTSAGFT